TVVHHQVRQIQTVFGRGEDTNFPPLGGITGHRHFGFPRNDGFWVVLQVRAHTRGVDANVYTGFLQMVSWTNAREHQQFRSVNGTRGNDDFAVCGQGFHAIERIAQVFDSGCSVVVIEQNLSDPVLGEDIEIFPVHDRVQV